MHNRIAVGRDDFPPPPPAPQQHPVPWSACGPQTPVEQWNFQRRQELLNLAGPIAFGLLRAQVELQGATPGEGAEPWKPAVDPAQLDAEAAERAVRLAQALQAAADRARPRS